MLVICKVLTLAILDTDLYHCKLNHRCWMDDSSLNQFWNGCKGLQKCKFKMLTERERHGMAELLGRMDPADLVSLAQVPNKI